MNFFKIVCIGLVLAIVPAYAHANTINETTRVQLLVPGCNDDGICEPDLGETVDNCPLDCVEPPAPPVSQPGSPSSGGNIPSPPASPAPALYIASSSIIPAETSATVIWTTNNTTISSLSWGATPDYELGTVGGAIYEATHIVTIDDLKPDTLYYVDIQAKDLYGTTLDYTASFVTQSLPISLPVLNMLLANPTDIKLVPQQNSNLITWSKPHDPNFRGVVIVRSPYEYPTDPNDGQVVYEGSGTSATDSTIALDTKYYYTIFSYGAPGIYSSGALVGTTFSQSPGAPVATTTPTALPTPSPSSAPSSGLNFSDFNFVQDSKVIQPINNVVNVLGTDNLAILLQKSKLHEALISAFVTIQKPSGPSEYILHEQSTSSDYYATELDISGYASGDYPISFELQPATSSQIFVQGTLHVTAGPPKKDYTWVIFLTFIAIAFAVLSFFFWFFFLILRHKKDKI